MYRTYTKTFDSKVEYLGYIKGCRKSKKVAGYFAYFDCKTGKWTITVDLF